jgi:hypothetical protein
MREKAAMVRIHCHLLACERLHCTLVKSRVLRMQMITLLYSIFIIVYSGLRSLTTVCWVKAFIPQHK